MSWDAVAPTITCGFVNPSKGRFLHPTQHRTINLREAALIQTFPRYYTFALDRGKFSAAWLIGNALPPKFIKKIVLPVVRYLRVYA
jgi:DNA (cytosine-5)-methyltransferase 1